MLNQHYLYVEDDYPSRLVLKKLMTSLGVTQFSMFEDSTDFIQRLSDLQPQPDVILMDIHMKPYTGFEMLRMLRAEPAFDSIKVVALTASVMNEEVEMLRNSGFNGVIAKPIKMSAFPSLLARISNGDAIWEIN